MHKIINTMKQVIAVAALAGFMCLPIAAPAAAMGCIDSGDCAGGESCSCSGGNACTQGGSCASFSVPEMSDYLAVAFLVAAGTMIYYIRRRELAA